MAVAMEMAWRGAELGSSPVLLSKKHAWGADTERLMQLMMGQSGCASATTSESKRSEVTLDLLVTDAAFPSSPSSLGAGSKCNFFSPEFLELDPDHPLPSGWEKCLDLKTGELYLVNKSTGTRTNEDPRKHQQQAALAVDTSVPSPLAHEFLSSKKSEILREERMRASTSPESSGDARNRQPSQLLAFSAGKQRWNMQPDCYSTVSLNKMGGSPRAVPFPDSSDEEESKLELNLNLSAVCNSPSRPHDLKFSVCTVEMVERALKRTEKALGKREMTTVVFDPKHMGSSSSTSSLTSVRSDPSWSYSPSTSSASSTYSRSLGTRATSTQMETSHAFVSDLEACEAESSKDATFGTGSLVMGACTRCIMYVMLNKSDPKCPRCESKVPLDFSSPSPKRQRLDTMQI
ncbi:uncharacterized protein [Physcomitrium patens]|uniref:WW domain-containing protein n=1 Tax=Physcomitrium patens TaxID=3218 RepID=A0A2K1KIJ3_PHYPA|nr:uncharacterized protein LOC112282207 [Physcomitrium patens]PNR53604.1 hypothetical protein PHYPA_007279 [Physcomitrium patens]|eukprot:XP_024375339.1 uncharacterized protein LOC112282207 [Physcomitrella patens]